MKVLSKEKREKKEIISNIKAKPAVKSRPEEPIVYSMKPEEEQMLLEELLGNFSDQTGACFG